MPDYQWAVEKGKLVISNYDRSMTLNAEQVENELKTAIKTLFEDANVSQVSDEYKEVYKITIPVEGFSKIFFVCLKGTTPGGRNNLQDEQRIQQKAKYLNYANERKAEGNKVSCLGVYKHESETIFCAWNINPSAASPETPISKQIKISTIAKAMREGFVQQQTSAGEYVCAFKKEFIYFYLINSEWIHNALVTHLNEHNSDDILVEENLSDDENNNNNETGSNVLLYGVPGCGKSYTIKTEYCDDETHMERAVFHPDYTYSDFVGQILPHVIGDHIKYEFTPGPFTRIMKKAYDAYRKYENSEVDSLEMFYLVIEEINRGNAPAIFGDIFQLLDRDENGTSEYGVSNENIAENIYGNKETKVKIPGNLYILATMNTSDQNVFTLDTAFKRRWTMRMIENNIDACEYAEHQICAWGISWGTFAKTINKKITELGENNLSNEDNRLGAYFVREADLNDAERFGEKILMYLWNDAFKFDHDKVFKVEYRTLDELIAGFVRVGFAVFSDDIVFETIAEETDDIVETDNPTAERYLEGKNPELVASYRTLFEAVTERIPNAYDASVGSLGYVSWKANDIKKASFADIYIRRNGITIMCEVPTSETARVVGNQIPVNNHHNHYFKIIFDADQTEQIVNAIVESYNQLKVQ